MPDDRVRKRERQTQLLSRSAGSTFVVERSSSGKTMTREAFDEVARRQDEYIANNDMLQIDGWIGNDPTLRTRAGSRSRSATRTSPACSRSSTSLVTTTRSPRFG